MCRSRMDGGQRCASHARATLTSANTAMIDANGALVGARLNGADAETVARLTTAALAAVTAQERAEIEFASTPTGERFFTDKITAMATNPTRHSNSAKQLVGIWHTTIVKGDLLREQNKEAGKLARLLRHPRGHEAAAEIADVRDTLGYVGWRGVNRVMHRMGIYNVMEDTYLSNVVAEQFGFPKDVHGKRPAPPLTPGAEPPARLVPAPLNATDFEVQYQPIRRDKRAADYVFFDSNRVRTPHDVKTLWSVQDHPDGTVTYHPGVVGIPDVYSYISTRKPWTTGLEQVHATSDDLRQSPLDREATR